MYNRESPKLPLILGGSSWKQVVRMDTTDGSGDLTLSDLELAVATIQTQSGLVGYRNLLSYTSALGIKVYSPDSLQVASWEKIGSGSYSATYRADVVTEPGTVVAVKQPIASFTREKKAVEDSLQHASLTSIIQELRTLANTKLKDHPNLPRVLGVYFQEETDPIGVRPCVLFELALSDLQQYLSASEGANMQAADLTRLACNIADGIGALHACGLVHGDLKPDNVLLYHRNELLTAVVADLGTCGVAAHTQRTINGSLWYSAPEYLHGSPFSALVNSPSRDVYSYGLILWSIMTRCREQPFPTDEQYDMQQSGRAATYLLDKIAKGCVIPAFIKAIHECLRVDPSTRPSIFQVTKSIDPAAETR
jgi:serine/threonine protein kinase